MINIVLLFVTSLISLPKVNPAKEIDLQVKITGISKLKGEIRIAIYSEDNEFLSGVDIIDYRVIPADSTTVT